MKTNTTKEVLAVLDGKSTGAIVWYLVKRHRFFLAIAGNALLLTYIVVSQAPVAINNFIKWGFTWGGAREVFMADLIVWYAPHILGVVFVLNVVRFVALLIASRRRYAYYRLNSYKRVNQWAHQSMTLMRPSNLTVPRVMRRNTMSNYIVGAPYIEPPDVNMSDAELEQLLSEELWPELKKC